MNSRNRFAVPAIAALAGLAVVAGTMIFDIAPVNAARTDYRLSQAPLYMGQTVPPLMMMVMSRDERLFTKAYSDYTDLDDNGELDTTYNDKFDYAGYFGPNTCYEYSGGKFTASKSAEGANKHSCKTGNSWSGNFLNWSTMSRLDVLRHVLYGGKRSGDTTSATVLERAHIPNDAHAWVKIYDGADLKDFVPSNVAGSGKDGISMCNASMSVDGDPLMRVVKGRYPEWAATSLYQCGINKTDAGSGNDAPKDGHTDLVVRVEVCNKKNAALEPFCREYPNSGSPVSKPSGLLQEYGENGRLRFGLLTGSASKPRSGGVLRRNIGKIAGNAVTQCAPGDEINLDTGAFCTRASGEEGIINAADRLKLDKWTGTSWSDCSGAGILNRMGGVSLNNPGTGGKDCSAWGNPVAEMYAEALRYIGGQSSAQFPSDSTLGLPNPAWVDPYGAGGNSYCANCNILVLSSGLSSFDSDEIPSGLPGGISAETYTRQIGTEEGIHGRNYLVGRVGATPIGAALDTHSDLCSSKTVGDLSLVRGLCPDTPTTEGSYLMSGLAKGAASVDLRPGLRGKPADYKVSATTFAVQLADNLPKFEIPVGGGKISLAPLCQANSSGNAKPGDSGWRSCALLSVSIGDKTVSHPSAVKHQIGRPLAADRSSGSFSLVWEDSMWGSDYDNDVVTMMSYCVGAACREETNPRYDGPGICWLSNSTACNSVASLGPNEALVRVENMSMYAGHSMLTGVAITGSDNDGVKRMVHMKGGFFESILTGNTVLTGDNLKAGWGAPEVVKVRLGVGAGAGQLENPLWYAAKHGAPSSERWDSREPGTPDNYFFARDPSKLKEALGAIFEKAAAGGAPTVGGGSGARIGAGSFTVEAGYDVPNDSNDWVGRLRAHGVSADGARSVQLWDASNGIPAHTDRKIFMVSKLPKWKDDGAIEKKLVAKDFTVANLENKPKKIGLNPGDAWVTKAGGIGNIVNYLRGDQTFTTLRARSSILGDIVNSDAAISRPRDDYGYGAWLNSFGESYRSYLTSKAGRGTTVFVGANDGMLHAVDGADGKELFAFIPHTSLKHIGELANPAYQHEYFVDGGIALGDVPSSGSGNWRTVLVGSTGAGGGKIGGKKSNGTVSEGSVFALDVSAPKSFKASDVLWELSGDLHDDMGFVLGRPHIVPIKWKGTTRWVALFGNGPNSNSGAPAVFVVDAYTGAVLDIAKPAAGTHSDRNGIMNIAPVDLTGDDGLVDAIYGGDLNGNVWKFVIGPKGGSSGACDDDDDDDDDDDGADCTFTPPADGWVAAFNGTPLFTAKHDGVNQPITGHIEVSRGPIGGVTLFFGTGKYFEYGDNSAGTIQSLYSIWDAPGGGAIADRTKLVRQVLKAGVAANGHRTREVTNLNLDYGVNRGWLVDLAIDDVASGERFIGAPRLQSGKVIFTTYEPGVEICGASGGTNWQYALDLMTGGGAMSGVSLDPAGDMSVCSGGDCAGIALNAADKPGAPVKSVDVFIPKPLRPGLGAACPPGNPSCNVDDLIEASRCTFVLHSPGAPPLYLPRPCGRQSWRQLR